MRAFFDGVGQGATAGIWRPEQASALGEGA
jgi:hypothetical protein